MVAQRGHAGTLVLRGYVAIILMMHFRATLMISRGNLQA